MRYLLDTNICIYIIKNKPENVLKRFEKLQADDVVISSITVAELQYGVEKSKLAEKNQEALNQFILPLEIIPFGHQDAIKYGIIRTNLEKLGTPIGAMDLLIASIAIHHNLTLVTNNTSEFSRIQGLKIDNWV